MNKNNTQARSETASGRVKPVTGHKTGANKWQSEASDKPQDWGKQVAE